MVVLIMLSQSWRLSQYRVMDLCIGIVPEAIQKFGKTLKGCLLDWKECQFMHRRGWTVQVLRKSHYIASGETLNVHRYVTLLLTLLPVIFSLSPLSESELLLVKSYEWKYYCDFHWLLQ